MSNDTWGVISITREAVIVDANSEACRLLRRPQEEIVGAGLPDIFDTSDHNLRNAWGAACTGIGYRGELRLLRGDGTVFLADVEMSSHPGAVDGDGTRVAFRDVTERKRAESIALWREEDRYRTLVPSVSDFIAVQRADSTLVYVSPSVENILGYKPEEMIGTLGATYVHPEDLERAWPKFYEILCAPGVSEPLRIRYRHKDGTWRRFEMIANNRLDDPDVEGVVCSCQAVTERNETEETLEGSEEPFRSLVQNISDIITILEADGTVRYVSPAGENVTGYGPEESVGTNAFGFVHPDDKPWALIMFAEVLKRPGVHPPLEFRVSHKDGSWRHLEHAPNNLLDDPSVKGVVVTSRDVTERVRTEEALRASMVTMHKSPDYLLRALRAGAAGYVLEDATREDLISATRRVLSGVSPLDPEVAAGLLRRVAETAQEPAETTSPAANHSELLLPLTPRELEVLDLLAMGRTNQEIAREFGVSRGTVKRHVENLIAKLGVSDRTQAVVRALDLGILTFPKP